MTYEHRNTYAGWAEAFKIFERYSDGCAQVCAEHDEIFAGPDPGDVSDADRAKLAALGWLPGDHGGFRRFT